MRKCSKEKIWKLILEADHKDSHMAAECYEDEERTEEHLEKLGIFTEHAYGVLGCAIVDDNGKEEHLV